MAKEFVGQEYLAATEGRGLQEDSRNARILVRTTVTCSILITIISVVMIGFCIFFAVCPVIGTSMMTTLNASGANTDSAITCILGEPRRGDIVVCKLYLQNTHYYKYLDLASKGDRDAIAIINELKKVYSEKDKKGYYMFIVKRLIGMPGDEISMRRVGDNYYIYRNGEKLDESYLDPMVAHPSAMNFKQLWNLLNDRSQADMSDWGSTTCIKANRYSATGEGEASQSMLIVPSDSYFLMGDNRGYEDQKYSHSWDSTYFGPLPKSNYVSHCVDIVGSDITMPEYLWKKFIYYCAFGWMWQ